MRGFVTSRLTVVSLNSPALLSSSHDCTLCTACITRASRAKSNSCILRDVCCGIDDDPVPARERNYFPAFGLRDHVHAARLCRRESQAVSNEAADPFVRHRTAEIGAGFLIKAIRGVRDRDVGPFG